METTFEITPEEPHLDRNCFCISVRDKLEELEKNQTNLKDTGVTEIREDSLFYTMPN